MGRNGSFQKRVDQRVDAPVPFPCHARLFCGFTPLTFSDSLGHKETDYAINVRSILG
jgi:hypothetical protein